MEFIPADEIKSEGNTMADLLMRFANRHHEIMIRALDSPNRFEWFAVEASLKTMHGWFGTHLRPEYQPLAEQHKENLRLASKQGDKSKILDVLTDWLYDFSANMGPLGVIPHQNVTLIASPIYPEPVEGDFDDMERHVKVYKALDLKGPPEEPELKAKAENMIKELEEEDEKKLEEKQQEKEKQKKEQEVIDHGLASQNGTASQSTSNVESLLE